MSENNFYEPGEMATQYSKIVPVYQSAFAGEPWYEVSKCVDSLKHCVGGLSSLAVGALCDTCGNCPVQVAYEEEELTARFKGLAESRPTSWYIERSQGEITLAAIAWTASLETIAQEKYQDAPEMKDWLSENVEANEIIWLDEVFANKQLRISGNLRNFAAMCIGFGQRLDNTTLAFRTINPAMIRAAERDFADNCNSNLTVPDWRKFVVINIEEREVG